MEASLLGQDRSEHSRTATVTCSVGGYRLSAGIYRPSLPLVTEPMNRETYIQPFINGNVQGQGDSMLLGQDLWMYQSWKAAFTACIDNAPATPEYKLLQLRQCLNGEALKAIESLGHSAAAYQAAKEQLDRKFEGQHRQIALYLEEIDQFIQGTTKTWRSMLTCEILRLLKLKEAKCYEELRDSLLYMKL